MSYITEDSRMINLLQCDDPSDEYVSKIFAKYISTLQLGQEQCTLNLSASAEENAYTILLESVEISPCLYYKG